MHETFHEDPTDISKRKLRRLRGTAANKWSLGLSIGLAALFGIGCHFFTESSWSNRLKEKFLKAAKVSKDEQLQQLMMKDIFWNSTVKNLRKKERGELPRPASAEA